jgi:hypothetical protein
MPRRDASRALVEIGGADRLHDRKARSRVCTGRAVRHHRMKPLAEDVLEILQGDGDSTAVRSSHLL